MTVTTEKIRKRFSACLKRFHNIYNLLVSIARKEVKCHMHPALFVLAITDPKRLRGYQQIRRIKSSR
tara:strand:+ start:179 stop:379 length:201 start_codon:yes stop_codon:yes gene_type:complete